MSSGRWWLNATPAEIRAVYQQNAAERAARMDDLAAEVRQCTRMLNATHARYPRAGDVDIKGLQLALLEGIDPEAAHYLRLGQALAEGLR